MFKKKSLTIAVASALGITSSGFVLPALAQEEELQLEEIIITGSRIKRRDLTGTSPITTVGAETISLSGTVNTEQLLNELPQVIPGATNTSNNPGDGTASVDLRGLGDVRTLVLVNSRRMVPTGASTTQTVDINNIPASLIDRVEVVTGGASAVYGSDAIAGVVNFVMKTDFEGVQLDLKNAETFEGDGNRYDVSLTIGGNFADDKGNAVMYFGYTDREEVLQGDRDFSSTALGDFIPSVEELAAGATPYLYPFGSSGIPGTRVFGDATFADGSVNTGGVRFLPDGSPVPYDGATDTYNFAPVNYLQLPQKRYTFNAFTHYDLTEKVQLYGEALYVNHETPQQLAPTPAQIQDFDFNYVANPFLTQESKDLFAASYDADGDGVATLARLRRRLVENEVRAADDDITTYRFVVGGKGDITDSWSWDAYYSFGKTARTSRLSGDAAESKFRQGLNVANVGGANVCVDPNSPTVGIEGCVPVNIWGEGNISPEAADFINVGATNTTEYQQQMAAVGFSGEIAQLPAGALGVAFGYERREEEVAFVPDEFLGSGDVLGFNSSEPTAGDFNVDEFYVEVNVPILSEAPGAYYLGATGAYRYSDYDTAVGDVNTYAYGLEWAPIDSLRFRAQAQRAVRAPNLFELHQGASNNFPAYTDPCAGGVTGALADFCIATGVPAASIPTFTEADSQVEATEGGNPDLAEETSDTVTLGFVWTPNFAEGLALTADYYKIELEDAIDVAGGGANNLIKLCYDGRDINSEFCQAITRDVTGDIVNVNALNANIAEFNVEGIDLGVTYQFNVPGIGLGGGDATLRLALLYNHQLENSFVPAPGEPTRECAGRFGTPCGQTITGVAIPENKSDFAVTYLTGPLSVRMNWNWIDGVDDTRLDDGTLAAQLPVPSIGSYSYWDLNLAYEITDNLQVSGGIDNVFDKEPPKYGDASVQANTDPSTYDVLGQRWYLGLTAKF